MSTDIAQEQEVTAPVKRGRGRPPKPRTPEELQAPKRGRGRPPKAKPVVSDQPQPSEPVEAYTDEVAEAIRATTAEDMKDFLGLDKDLDEWISDLVEETFSELSDEEQEELANAESPLDVLTGQADESEEDEPPQLERVEKSYFERKIGYLETQHAVALSLLAALSDRVAGWPVSVRMVGGGLQVEIEIQGDDGEAVTLFFMANDKEKFGLFEGYSKSKGKDRCPGAEENDKNIEMLANLLINQ